VNSASWRETPETCVDAVTPLLEPEPHRALDFHFAVGPGVVYDSHHNRAFDIWSPPQH
jgi:hypothetical protein